MRLQKRHVEKIRKIEDKYGSVFDAPDDYELLIELQKELAFNINPWGGIESVVNQYSKIPKVEVGSFKGQVVKEKLKRMNATQGMLAEAVGLTISTVSQKLNGKIWITYKQLYDMLEFTGLDLRDVVDEKTFNEIMNKQEEDLIAAIKKEYEDEEAEKEPEEEI